MLLHAIQIAIASHLACKTIIGLRNSCCTISAHSGIVLNILGKSLLLLKYYTRTLHLPLASSIPLT
jgi:hypothetical protein